MKRCGYHVRMEEPIGLIAGQGSVPLLQARGIHAAGRTVACVGLAGQYEPTLPEECDYFATSGLVRLGRWVRLLRRWGVKEAVMVGGVRKTSIMYDPLRVVRQIPDARAALLWYRVLRHDKRDQVLLGAVADELQRSGITLIDTTRYIPQHLGKPGVLTRTQPSSAQQGDIAFGWDILMRMNDLDIGQSIAVKERDVIAVEAMEGTDEMIERAGQLCRSRGWTLLKGPRPDKDLRFDVPTVGVKTIEGLHAAGAGCLAISAGKVIIVDQPAVLAAADECGVAVVAVEPIGPSAAGDSESQG